MIQLKVITINASSEEIAKVYQDKVWKLHGVLQKVLSNREPQFVSRFMEDLIKTLGTKRTLSIVYHFQTDGQTE